MIRFIPKAAALTLSVLLTTALWAEPPKEPTTADLLKAINGLRTDIDLARNAQNAHLKLLSDQVAELKQRVADLEKKTDKVEKRTSNYPADTGTIRLENRLGVPATIVVNGVPYRLGAFQTRELPAQPAGSFTYEALVDGEGSLTGGTATRTLFANRVYTIFTYRPVFTFLP